MLVDGSYLTCDQVVASLRDFKASLSLFHTEWTSLRIVPLGQNAGVSLFALRDSIVTRAGELIRSQGTTSFVWQSKRRLRRE